MTRDGGAGVSERRGRRERLLDLLFLALAGGCLVGLQTTLLGRLPLPFLRTLPSSPSLGLLFALAVGLRGGEIEGAAAGLLLGWLCDSVGGDGTLLLPLLYLLAGYLAGTVGRRVLSRNLPSFLVVAAVGAAAEGILFLLRTAVRIGGLPPARLAAALLPRFLLTLLGAPPVYAVAALRYGRRGRAEVRLSRRPSGRPPRRARRGNDRRDRQREKREKERFGERNTETQA